MPCTAPRRQRWPSSCPEAPRTSSRVPRVPSRASVSESGSSSTEPAPVASATFDGQRNADIPTVKGLALVPGLENDKARRDRTRLALDTPGVWTAATRRARGGSRHPQRANLSGGLAAVSPHHDATEMLRGRHPASGPFLRADALLSCEHRGPLAALLRSIGRRPANPPRRSSPGAAERACRLDGGSARRPCRRTRPGAWRHGSAGAHSVPTREMVGTRYNGPSRDLKSAGFPGGGLGNPDTRGQTLLPPLPETYARRAAFLPPTYRE